jgi:esterase/lipase
MGGNIDRKINEGEGPYVFRVNGQIHHQIGSLLPQTDMIPKFAQLYIFDTKNEIQNRIRALTNEETGDTDIDPYIVQELKKMLDKHNSLVKVFRHARDIFEKYKGIDISIRIIGANKDDAVQFQMPHR